MKLTAREVLTVPNAMTFTRLVASPFLAWKMYKKPAETWPKAAAVAFSDNFDGIGARLGRKHPLLALLGFRESELGRKADPFVDKVFTAEMLAAGLANGVIPKWLGGLSLAQKGLVAGLTLHNESRGIELAVTKIGKHAEFLTNISIGSLFAAESIEDQEQKQKVRRTAITAAVGGIATAFVATYGYYKAGKVLSQQLDMPVETSRPVMFKQPLVQALDNTPAPALAA